MKKGDIFYIISFFAGVITCYISTQFYFFDIDYKVSVFDFVFSFLGLIIGGYIAFVLEKRRNQNQNFYTFVEKKFDSLWEEYINFSESLKYSNNIEIFEISKSIKMLQQKLTPILRIYESSEHTSESIAKIETSIDALEEILTENDHTENNIVSLDNIRLNLNNLLENIDKNFASAFNDLHKL